MLRLSSSKIDSMGEFKGLARVAVSFATVILLSSISPMGGDSPSVPWSLITSASADDSSPIVNSNSNSPSLSVGKSVTLPSGVQYYDAVGRYSVTYVALKNFRHSVCIAIAIAIDSR